LIPETWEAYWKERSVIRKEDDVDGRASVTKDEERVLDLGVDPNKSTGVDLGI